jgi:hypothetical protein
MVKGLVIQTNAMDNGILAENITAPGAANSIWKGTGTKAKNNPTAKALDIERRLKFHKLGSCRCFDSQTKCL